MAQETTNENVTGLRRICYRSYVNLQHFRCCWLLLALDEQRNHMIIIVAGSITRISSSPDFLTRNWHVIAQFFNSTPVIVHCCQSHVNYFPLFALMHCLFEGVFRIKRVLNVLEDILISKYAIYADNLVIGPRVVQFTDNRACQLKSATTTRWAIWYYLPDYFPELRPTQSKYYNKHYIKPSWVTLQNASPQSGTYFRPKVYKEDRKIPWVKVSLGKLQCSS